MHVRASDDVQETVHQQFQCRPGPIGLSAGESDYYACVKGGDAFLGLRSLMEDWGLDVGLALRLRGDSSATQGFASTGPRRQRHVSTRFLWLQDKVSRGELRITKV